MAAMDGADPGGRAWDSALPVDDFAAIRSVGFEPVGQAFGAAVYYLATVAGVSCPGTTSEGYPPPGAPDAAGPPAAGPENGPPGPAAKLAQGLYEGWRTAIGRLGGECAGLGGHGVVGAVGRYPAFSAPSIRCREPDTYSDWSDSSHMTRLATSAAVP